MAQPAALTLPPPQQAHKIIEMSSPRATNSFRRRSRQAVQKTLPHEGQTAQSDATSAGSWPHPQQVKLAAAVSERTLVVLTCSACALGHTPPRAIGPSSGLVDDPAM